MLRTAATYASINIHLSISNFLILGQNLIQTLIRQTPPVYILQSSISHTLSELSVLTMYSICASAILGSSNLAPD